MSGSVVYVVYAVYLRFAVGRWIRGTGLEVVNSKC